jgi:hypothetical protein
MREKQIANEHRKKLRLPSNQRNTYTNEIFSENRARVN